MILALAILAVLASVVVPMAEMTALRGKELELRRSLREIRTAIDNYKADFDRAVLEKVSQRWSEYGFKGASPVADMIPRLTRPEIKKATAK